MATKNEERELNFLSSTIDSPLESPEAKRIKLFQKFQNIIKNITKNKISNVMRTTSFNSRDINKKISNSLRENSLNKSKILQLSEIYKVI